MVPSLGVTAVFLGKIDTFFTIMSQRGCAAPYFLARD